MTHYKIISRWTGTTLYEGEAETLRDLVATAVRSDANLRGADLRGANLRDANLRDANLVSIRDDVWSVLSAAPAEVPVLLAKLKAGEVDGSVYEGACACLLGTIANARGCNYHDLEPVLIANSSRPAEVFFAAIRPGDTPDKSQPAKIASEWIEDWLTRMRAAFLEL